METLDEPTLAAALAATVEDGNRLEALWNKHMSAAISASPELATMPGMRKLARYDEAAIFYHSSRSHLCGRVELPSCFQRGLFSYRICRCAVLVSKFSSSSTTVCNATQSERQDKDVQCWAIVDIVLPSPRVVPFVDIGYTL